MSAEALQAVVEYAVGALAIWLLGGILWKLYRDHARR